MVDCDRATGAVIQREIREGTPNTPERIATMRRADAAYAAMRAMFGIVDDMMPVAEVSKGWTWVTVIPRTPVTDALAIGYQGA